MAEFPLPRRALYGIPLCDILPSKNHQQIGIEVQHIHLLGIPETAALLDIPVDTIRHWLRKGLIKAHLDAENNKLLNVDEVQHLQRKLNGENFENRYRILQDDQHNGLTSIDLFAGAGGTALGLSHAGFEHLLINEFDRHAAATLRLNRPDWNVIDGDIHDVDFTHLRNRVDLVEGGFPCQAFSSAGNRLGFADTRGTLFHEFLRCVKEVQPKVALGENVRGLLTHDGGKTFKIMLKALQDAGYRVVYKLLRAQYLDVPQKRERLIIIAVRNDLDYGILFPRERDYTISLREALADCPESVGIQYSKRKFDVMRQVPEGGNWRDLPEDVQRDYMKTTFFAPGGKTGIARRLAWDEPSLTLTCSPSQKQTERCHPVETRPLTMREYARIQTFPDDWEFSGGVTAAYKQIGNAVPCNLAYHLGKGVEAMIKGVVPEGFELVEPVDPIVEV